LRFSLKVKGTKGLARRIKRVADKADDGLLRAYRQAALLVVREAKQRTDVQFYHAGRPWKKTGSLKRSIREEVTREVGGVRAVVGTGLIYSRIHEYGGRAGRGHAAVIPARPYLEPALDAKHREIFELIAREFGKILKPLK